MLSLHSSAVSASPNSGSFDKSKEVFSVSAETPPHTPVMLKEVLHYLDIQPAQVCLHSNYLCKPFGVHDFVYVYLFKSYILEVIIIFESNVYREGIP